MKLKLSVTQFLREGIMPATPTHSHYIDLSPDRLQTRAARLGFTIPTAAVASLILVALMTALVAPQRIELSEVFTSDPIIITRMLEDTAVDTRQQPTPKAELPEQPPMLPDSFDPRPLSPDAPKYPIPKSGPDIFEDPGPVLAPPGGDAFILVAVAPTYPIPALEAGIEGWVLVELSLSTDGSVADARVIASEPGSIFNRSALKAVRKWKYSPKIVDGVAVPQHGIRQRIVFEMEKS